MASLRAASPHAHRQYGSGRSVDIGGEQRA
jgi:hypothetical protein